MQKKIIAVIFALFTGTVSIFLAIKISHQIYPLQEEVSKDPSVLLMGLMCYATGAFIAGATANRIMNGEGRNQVLIIAGILTAFGLLNLLKFPDYPIWYWVAGLTLYFPLAILGEKYMASIMERMKQKDPS